MTEVTPDLIAEIATRLLNDVPQSSTDGIPASPVVTAVPQQPFYPANSYVPSAYRTSSSDASPQGRVSPIAVERYAPAILPAPVNPDFTPDTPVGAPHHVADVSPDGLRNFVEQIRNPAPQPDCGFGFGAPGVAFLKQILAPNQIPKPVLSGGSRPFDVPSIRRDFPALNQRVHGKPLIWFDNAATTQKPQSVIDSISYYYAHDNSNIHRAAHTLAARSTDAFEGVREKVQRFLGAGSSKEIIFVRGTTEGVNLIAKTYGQKFLQPGDEILLSTLEHHANIVPWQMVAKEKGAIIRVIPVSDRGEVMLEEYQALLGPRTKIVALTQASNSLGTILPVTEMTHLAKRYGARVLIDGAQSVSHIPVNVQDIGCDFFVFSGHKIFGPTGIGVVYAREELQEIMPPWQGGGNMIKNVTFEETTYSDPPNKFEAGTPNIADTVGLGAALDYVQSLGLTNIGKYEHHLLEYATERLRPIDGLRLIGQARDKVSVISFVLKDRRTEEVGKLLDLEGIAVRAGHHCSQPSLRRYGVDATVRPSFAFYNTTDEIDHLVASVKRISVGTVNVSTASASTTPNRFPFGSAVFG
ncbi:MAG: SufS family cysteine desulfurase [Schlesneria sp.]